MSILGRVILISFLFFSINSYAVLPIVAALPASVSSNLTGAVATAASSGTITQKSKKSWEDDYLQQDVSGRSQNIDAITIFKKLADAVKNMIGSNKCQERKSSCSTSPEECCKEEFFAKYGIGHHGSGRPFYKNQKQKKGLLCCLEWDHLHGAFEIFDSNGRHLGERGCDDLSGEDPCDYTSSRGPHALPNSSNHIPRSRECSR